MGPSGLARRAQPGDNGASPFLVTLPAMTRRLLLLFLTLCCFAGTAAKADRINYLPGIAPADHYAIKSAETGRPHHVFVRLPEGYEQSEKTYPVVYLLDGDILFPIIAAYHLLLAFDEPVPDAIIVGVGYGTFDRDKGNYRAVDYSTPPLPEEFRRGVDDGAPDGGAARFQNFLRDEVFPLIESTYRADPARRILLGQSRGAHFILYSAIADPDLVWGRIASNPSLQPNRDFFFQDYGLLPDSGGKLYFSNGTRDWERLRTETLKLLQHLEGEKNTPWRLNLKELHGETHAAGIVTVYRDAMIWLFADEPMSGAGESKD